MQHTSRALQLVFSEQPSGKETPEDSTTGRRENTAGKTQKPARVPQRHHTIWHWNDVEPVRGVVGPERRGNLPLKENQARVSAAVETARSRVLADDLFSHWKSENTFPSSTGRQNSAHFPADIFRPAPDDSAATRVAGQTSAGVFFSLSVGSSPPPLFFRGKPQKADYEDGPHL